MNLELNNSLLVFYKDCTPMATECEAKIRVEDLEPLRHRLEEAGAVNEGEYLERNWVLDFPDGSLHSRGTLLRVRNVGEVGGVLTVKHRVDGGAFKTREEVESMVDSTEDLLRQLEILGFQVKCIYEKLRGTWLFYDCVLALDECPEMGSFIEIEGTPERIREAALQLELDPNDHLDDNYLELWRKYLEEKGEAHRHMVFTPELLERKRRSGLTTRKKLREQKMNKENS